jgi:hypothetical protein
MLVKIFFHTQKKRPGSWYWRRLYPLVEGKKNLIPDSGGLVSMIEDQQKRERSDTVSTTLSDKPASKGPDIRYTRSCTRVNMFPIGNCKRNMKFNEIVI